MAKHVTINVGLLGGITFDADYFWRWGDTPGNNCCGLRANTWTYSPHLELLMMTEYYINEHASSYPPFDKGGSKPLHGETTP